MGYAKIACCDGCGKKRYVERVNARWLCLDCQDVATEEQPPATKASSAVPQIALSPSTFRRPSCH